MQSDKFCSTYFETKLKVFFLLLLFVLVGCEPMSKTGSFIPQPFKYRKAGKEKGVSKNEFMRRLEAGGYMRDYIPTRNEGLIETGELVRVSINRNRGQISFKGIVVFKVQIYVEAETWSCTLKDFVHKGGINPYGGTPLAGGNLSNKFPDDKRISKEEWLSVKMQAAAYADNWIYVFEKRIQGVN